MMSKDGYRIPQQPFRLVPPRESGNSHPIQLQNCANLATASTPAHNDIVLCVLLGERKTNVVVFSKFDLNFVMEKAFLNDNSHCRYFKGMLWDQRNKVYTDYPNLGQYCDNLELLLNCEL